MSDDVTLDVTPIFAFPAIEDALHMMRHPGHRDVAQKVSEPDMAESSSRRRPRVAVMFP
jgi:hypothetical protein